MNEQKSVEQTSLEQVAGINERAKRSWADGDYRHAKDLFLQSLSLLEAAYGKEHPYLLPTVQSLGLMLRAQGNFDEAKSWYERALTIAELFSGYESLATATQLNYLSGLYNAQKEYLKAQAFLERSLSIYEQRVGENNRATALTLMALAIVCKRQNKDTQSEQFYVRAAGINEKLGSVADEPAIAALLSLAEVVYLRGRLDDADLIFRHAVLMEQEKQFPEHPLIAESLVGVARVYCEYKFYNDAGLLYEKAISIWDKLEMKNTSLYQEAFHEFEVLCCQLAQSQK